MLIGLLASLPPGKSHSLCPAVEDSPLLLKGQVARAPTRGGSMKHLSLFPNLLRQIPVLGCQSGFRSSRARMYALV